MMRTGRARCWQALGLLAVLVGAVGCGAPPPPALDLVWPPPPARPMVAYERSIYGSASLDRSLFARMNDFIFGESPDQFLAKPYGIACQDEETLYVVDTARKGVMIFDLGTGRTHFFNSLGPHGVLAEPVGLALDAEGQVYVADTRRGRVAIFGPGGEFSRFLGAEGELLAPVGMAFSPDRDRLYVVDTQLHAVKVFDQQGVVVGSFGGRGDQQGELYHPLGIAVSSGGVVYVVDSFHFAVQAFDPLGQFLFSFGSTAKSAGSLARPRAIALDSDGHLYVTDALNNNVQIYDAKGRPLFDFGAYGRDEGRFRLPAGICINSDDTIYVVDSINRRIQEFRYLRPIEETSS